MLFLIYYSYVLSYVSSFSLRYVLCFFVYSDWYLLYLPTQPTPLLVRVGDTIILQ